MMRIRKTTHIRVDRDIVNDFHVVMPGVKHSDIIRMAWLNYKAVQKAGRFVYGKVWKVPQGKKTK